MKKIAIISLFGLSALACQQQAVQESVQPAAAPAGPSTGTCVFGAKSGRSSEVTTHNDCLLRGGNFIPSNSGMTAAPAPVPVKPAPSAPSDGHLVVSPTGTPTPVQSSGGQMVESL